LTFITRDKASRPGLGLDHCCSRSWASCLEIFNALLMLLGKSSAVQTTQCFT